MKKLIKICVTTNLEGKPAHVALLFFRVFIALELMIVHGFKKIGIGVNSPEVVPNPLGLPENSNELIAILANLGFPIFIIVGFCTRVATLPILCVTLIGLVVVHVHDSLLIKDVPFMYSVVFLFLLVVGPGNYSIDAIIYKKYSK
ncbi:MULTISPECIES: DoxX family protein [Cellulophaga]|uniref:DoxX family protein n=1 Tax=Cellulophaga TaxID=104264 RepID=UPI00046F59F5|nr:MULTISPECIES: DoxX family protein [Cellulophaga]AIY13964.1 hypothetical protein M667_12505 [Cellulophaga baltica NN016038]KGK29162.1 hypothetical protein EL45_18095 [Cellulophaga sp. E6(2014)]MBA6314683.1 DoxX family protein [Cellulophaga baltica]